MIRKMRAFKVNYTRQGKATSASISSLVVQMYALRQGVDPNAYNDDDYRNELSVILRDFVRGKEWRDKHDIENSLLMT